MRSFTTLQPEPRGTAIALGFFDGVHMGHRNVLAPVAAQRESGLVPVCLTFDRSPRAVLTHDAVPLLMTSNDKQKALSSLGIEHTYFADFHHLMNMSAEHFVKYILCEMLKARRLFCGFNYRFGKNGEGDAETLESLCRSLGVSLTVVPPTMLDGELVSSTAIRNYIAAGEIARANRMLCSPFGFCERIEHGRRLGRELGTPTLNQPMDKALATPRFGVYLSRVTLESGESFCGVTNVGVKPTVGNDTPLWETWMPQYTGGEIYGQKADVRLLEFIRPEQKFDSLDALKEEILRNGEQAVGMYGKMNTEN